ncbi:MAG: hypothetical protein E6G35_00635 [Actinobacteria bacterium]|nr:MAG: hypothetical protein E6G35_00635 [Actinomycetota bacterium]
MLDREFEDVTLEQIVNAPVSALAGVSAGVAKLLQDAFNIKTVGDLCRNKYFRAAVTLSELAELVDRVK